MLPTCVLPVRLHGHYRAFADPTCSWGGGGLGITFQRQRSRGLGAKERLGQVHCRRRLHCRQIGAKERQLLPVHPERLRGLHLHFKFEFEVRVIFRSANSFLCTQKDYANFELEFEVKVEAALNSGVQIRSQSLPTYQSGRVHGYQVEIAVAGFSGGISDEARRGKFLNDPDKPTAEIQQLVKDNQWARYRVM